MKNTFKRIGVIAVVVITGFMMTGCLWGTYVRNGNDATILVWGYESGTATVSGNRMTGIFYFSDYEDIDFTVTRRAGTGIATNPFVGTWTGTIEGSFAEIVVTATSWELSFPDGIW